MKKIKLSHYYLKLGKIDITEPVTLVHVISENTAHLSSEFLEYDTVYYDEGQIRHYVLDMSMDCLILFFVDSNGILFTTIRRSTPSKKAYYMDGIGSKYELVME